jgi:tetratricopeptide (TPR) repeat protein
VSQRFLTGFILLSTLLSGCAAIESTTQSANAVSPEPAPLAAPPVKPFPAETLFELLLAETAGIRGLPGMALEIYTRQAQQTRDPQVAERATNIAAFLQNQQGLLANAALWSELSPDNPHARQLYALALIQQGKYLDAFPHAAFALQHGFDEPILNLAAYAEKSSSEDQHKLLEQHQHLKVQLPDNASLNLAIAMLHQHLQQTDQALAIVSKLNRREPDNELAALLTSQLLHQQKHTDKALSILRNSLDLLPQSRKLRLQYARFLARDDLMAAHEQLSILAKQFPNDAKLHFSLALASEQLGKTDQAITTFERLTSHPASSTDAHFELARIAESAGDPAKALYHYRQVRRGRNLVPAAAKAASILARNDELDEALQHLRTLRLEQTSYSVMLYEVESELLMQYGQLSHAYDVLSDALNQHPENIPLLYARSIVSERSNKISDSEADLRAILKKDENNATALNALGYTLTLHTERYEEAHQLILKALNLRPEDPAIIDSLGWVLYHLGRYDEALQQLQLAMSKMPDPEIAAHLGEVLWTLNRQEEAKKVWQQILDVEPDNPIVTDTLKRLQVR